MWQRLALVVVDDPLGQVTAPRDRWLVEARLVIADSASADVRVAGATDRITLVRDGGRLTSSDARCAVNGVAARGAVDGPVDLGAGDLVGVGGVVFRVVEAALLDRVHRVGDWLVLENLWTARDAGPVFGPLSSRARRVAWLSSAALDDDDDVMAFARAGGSCDGLAAVCDTLVRQDEIGVVFDVSAHVALSDFRRRATSSGAPPLSVALRVGLTLNGALLALWDSAHRSTSLDAVVTFDGRVLLRPSATPWQREAPVRGERYTPAQARALARGTSRDDDMGLFEERGGSADEPDAAGVADVVCGLAADHVELQTLARRAPGEPLSPLVVDALLRRLALAAGLADDDEVAGLVCGLFADEHRRALALEEELQLLDDDAVARLLR